MDTLIKHFAAKDCLQEFFPPEPLGSLLVAHSLSASFLQEVELLLECGLLVPHLLAWLQSINF